jgi:hypothetical protein
MVYDAIRRINEEVGRFVSDQLENLEDGRALAARLNGGERTDAQRTEKTAAQPDRPRCRRRRRPRCRIGDRARR